MNKFLCSAMEIGFQKLFGQMRKSFCKRESLTLWVPLYTGFCQQVSIIRYGSQLSTARDIWTGKWNKSCYLRVFGGSHVTFLNMLLRGFTSSNHQQYSLQQKYFLLSFQWAATLLQLYRVAVLLACWARLVCSAMWHLPMLLLLLIQPKKQKSSEQLLQLCLHMLPPCTDSCPGQPILNPQI